MTNRIHDAFDQLETSEKLKSSTLQFLHDEREQRLTRAARPVRSIAFAACAVSALFLAIGLYTMQMPVSYISIDVNPSVELTLNCYDRVIAATAYNEDGENILKGIRVRGRLYTDAIDAIIEGTAMQPYLTPDSALTFTVAASDSTKEDAILTGIESSPGYQSHNGQCHTADVTSLPEAHASGLSFGKYAAYLVLSQFDSAVTPEDCRNMSMSEIHSQINEHQNHNGFHGNLNESGGNSSGSDSHKKHGH